MNLVNEIGSDVARAFLIDKKGGDKIDVSRLREILRAIRLALKDRKVVEAPVTDDARMLVAKASQ